MTLEILNLIEELNLVLSPEDLAIAAEVLVSEDVAERVETVRQY